MQFIRHYFTLTIGWLIIYFLPIVPFILIVGFFVLADTITGIIAAHHRGEEITSKRFRSVVSKYIVYGVAVCVAHVIQRQFFYDFPAMKLISGLIAYSELLSIDENIKDITGFSFFKTIIKRLAQYKK